MAARKKIFRATIKKGGKIIRPKRAKAFPLKIKG
jgi:hypothetical protein